jgi:hypothetical protein
MLGDESMRRKPRMLESSHGKLETSVENCATPSVFKGLAAYLETEPYDGITAVTLQELARMFERKNGTEVFKGSRSSFEEALYLVAEILVVKTLHGRLEASYLHHKELFSRLLFHSCEIAGELCEQWAGELTFELQKLEAQYVTSVESVNK